MPLILVKQRAGRAGRHFFLRRRRVLVSHPAWTANHILYGTGYAIGPGRYTITIGVNRTATTLAFDVLIDYPALVVTLPGLDSGKVEWPERPWGIVHWKQVDWQADT